MFASRRWTSTARAERIGVRAVQRAHRPARQPRRGRTHGLPGTLPQLVVRAVPLPHAEAGFGYPERGETVINVTNGKLIRLLRRRRAVRRALRHAARRTSGCSTCAPGTLTRTAHGRRRPGKSVRVTSTRLVSFTQRRWPRSTTRSKPLDGPSASVVQSELVDQRGAARGGDDPRVAADARVAAGSARSTSSTDRGRSRCTARARAACSSAPPCTTRSTGPKARAPTGVVPRRQPRDRRERLAAGQRLRLVKFLAYGWSSRRSRPAVHDQVVAALAGATLSGWDGAAADQRARLDEFWAGADVEVEGDPRCSRPSASGCSPCSRRARGGASSDRRPRA